MTKYEGLFILNLAGREEGVKDLMDRISAAINESGGKVENVEKMDKRAFSRVADKKVSSGFYVNYVFEGTAETLAAVQTRFQRDDEVFRIMFTRAEKAAPAVAA